MTKEAGLVTIASTPAFSLSRVCVMPFLLSLLLRRVWARCLGVDLLCGVHGESLHGESVPFQRESEHG